MKTRSRSNCSWTVPSDSLAARNEKALSREATSLAECCLPILGL